MNVAIIGAGFAGLAAGYELQKAGHRVVLFDGAAQAGGLASGFKATHWEWPLERFYHHLFTSDDVIINFTQEVGFGDHLLFRRPLTAFVYKDRPYPFDTPLAVLRYPGLSLVEKLRTGLPVLYLRLQRDWRPLERVTADAWMRRVMGASAYHKTWEPLLIGKFGRHYQDVPMSWFWARIFKRTPRLVYYAGGFQAFADHLVKVVEGRGGAVHLNTRVQRLRPDGDGWMVASDQGERFFDRVIATAPPNMMERLVPELPNSYLASLRELKSLGAVVMVVALKQRLTDGYYWINLDKRDFPMLALVEHTNMIDPAHYGGDHLVYLGDYLPADHAYFGYDAGRLFEVYETSLRRFNPAYTRDWVREKWLFKASYAQPVVPLNYSSQIPSLRTPLAGLYFASMSQVYPWDRGTNYAVELGQKVAATLLSDGEPGAKPRPAAALAVEPGYN
ncbi:MAG TPA: NAD(P)/FAD-dependent oxidoreductase [Ardenticatenaceae bacterium]|nr:NAD(P)/FAD-dependent oxidoreductase [Ardenticatenaceae bacterium]